VADDVSADEENESPVSITNSFGMPSRDPAVWQEDASRAKSYLTTGQVFIVSVVGTPRKGEDLAEDYARGALLAKEAGADVVEINLSCPNVTTGEGSIFTDPSASSSISKKVHQALQGTPLIIKMGYIPDHETLEKVILANAPHVEGISGINTLSFKVVKRDGSQALPGPGRLQSGVCGDAIRRCGLTQVERAAEIRRRHRLDFSLIGVGGIMAVEDILAYEKAGADASMSATGAMWDPYLALKYYQEVLVQTK
jgi:dihydroorotate dehydrogenase (NAD+) catalytic subunit